MKSYPQYPAALRPRLKDRFHIHAAYFLLGFFAGVVTVLATVAP